MDLADGLVHPRFEDTQILKGFHPDGGDEVTVLTGPGTTLHIPQFCAIGRAGEHRRKHAHYQGQGCAFEAADGHQQPVDGRRGIGGGAAFPVQCPAFRQGPALLLVDADFAVGGAAESCVEDNRAFLPGWDGDAQRVDAQNSFRATPGSHCGQGVGGGNADHPVGHGLGCVVGHGAAVIAAPDARGRDAVDRCPFDHPFGGEVHPDLAHGIAAVHHQTRAHIPHQ